jgi:hypothetical protein
LVAEVEELRISSARASAQASRDQAEIMKLKKKLSKGGGGGGGSSTGHKDDEHNVDGGNEDDDDVSVMSLEKAVEDAKISEAETVNRLNAEIRSLMKEITVEKGRASAAEIHLEEQRALLESKTQEAEEELVKIKQQQSDLEQAMAALRRREAQGESGILRQRIAELESENKSPFGALPGEVGAIAENDADIKDLLEREKEKTKKDSSGDNHVNELVEEKLKEERQARREMLESLNNYKVMLGKMHDRMLIMSRVFAAKENGRKKVEKLEAERLEVKNDMTSMLNFLLIHVSPSCLACSFDLYVSLIPSSTFSSF